MKFRVPIIDLFAGPGGLAEGFTPLRSDVQSKFFHVLLSFEADPAAYRTLRLRAFLRKFRNDPPSEYYEFMNGKSLDEPNWSVLYPSQWNMACNETRCMKLGLNDTTDFLNHQIRQIRKSCGGRTLLVGGPPCQSYSVIGRARNVNSHSYNADKDERQSFYIQFVNALQMLRPAVAVMENVRGILSAKHRGTSVFSNVMEALRHAGGEDEYALYALTSEDIGRSWRDGLPSREYLVRCETHGVPQSRHRIFVVCIRHDLAEILPTKLIPRLEPVMQEVTVADIIGRMPILRSRLSRADSGIEWQRTIRKAIESVQRAQRDMNHHNEIKFRAAVDQALHSTNGSILPFENECGGTTLGESCPDNLGNWLYDARLTRLPNNQTRGHNTEDLARYIFAVAFAQTFNKSPKDIDFPSALAPNHASWRTGKFSDRFRVQLFDRPSSTITSHIAKDGHYFIHPDPAQCRSLTVREAARLQTFPDNYYFQGTRSQQYVQVGNAVPPFLAQQIAASVAKVFEYCDKNSVRSRRLARRHPTSCVGSASRKEQKVSGTMNEIAS